MDENTGSCRRSCLILSKPLIMIIAATALIILRIWATFLDFLLYHSKVEGNNFYCTSANLIILAFAVSHTNWSIVLDYSIMLSVA